MKGIFLNSRKKLRTRKADTINPLFLYIGLTWSCKIQYKKQSGTLPTSLSIEQTVRKVLTFFLYFNSLAIRSPAERWTLLFRPEKPVRESEALFGRSDCSVRLGSARSSVTCQKGSFCFLPYKCKIEIHRKIHFPELDTGTLLLTGTWV
jgi:hypothetical protein